MTARFTELPYCQDSARLFARLAHKHWSIFLDSGYPYINLGRYDIIAADPYVTVTTIAGETRISHADGRSVRSLETPFSVLKSLLGEPRAKPMNLPFAGGALGYFSYDLARGLETLPELSVRDIDIPELAVGIYDWAVVTDHHQGRTWLVGGGKNQSTLKRWDELHSLFQTATPEKAGEFRVLSEPSQDMDKITYAHAFNRIKRYIRSGDCYQVNLAQRFSVNVSGDPWNAYLALRRLNPAPYGGFFNIPEGALLCTSPERFIKVEQRRVETRPIKGTRRRVVDPNEDQALRGELLASEKDRAENLMIVDLLRNDLGKSCSYGSISTPSLFSLESFASVHHLVSTVVGRLADGAHALDLLCGCFPGGSITGAPKVRAMEIIEALEPYRRSVYCGAMAYIGFDGNMDSNIIIRSLVYHRERMYCWAGGGIVMDSRLEAEYQECFDKAAALFDFFKAVRAEHVGR